MKIAGVMTGTSCDGLDAACLEFPGEGWRMVWSRSTRYPAQLRERVLMAQRPGQKLSIKEWGELNRDLGIWFAKVLKRFCAGNGADVIACHGQTVAHFPASPKGGFTMQLGDPARLVAETGLTVVSNFREGDMAAGGEGAPLAPRFHQLLAREISPKGRIAIHNIGGISNLTYIDARGGMTAFDTGPGNIWIDAAAALVSGGAARFDRDGKMASVGSCDKKAAQRILGRKYFQRPPPKSTGRDDFPFEDLLSLSKRRDESLVSTATEITVDSIVRAYQQFILPRGLEAIYFCGGGARNSYLIEQIRRRLAMVKVATLDDAGFDSKYLEAQAFAYLGWLALKGNALGGPWTGAKEHAPSAHIIPGPNWPKIVQRLAAELARTSAGSTRSKKRQSPAR